MAWPRISNRHFGLEVARTSAQITRLLAEHGLGPRAPPVDHAKVRLPRLWRLAADAEPFEAEEGAAEVVAPDAVSGPLTRITLSTEAFTRRGAGRRDLANTPYAVSGDPAIAAAVVEHLVITP